MYDITSAIFPILLYLLQFCKGLLFEIPQAGGFFEVLGSHNDIFLHAQSLDFLFEFENLLGDGDMRKMNACTCLVQHIKGFIRQETVGNVSICHFDARPHGLVGVANAMVLFVAILHIGENLQRFVGRRRLYDNLLEPTV